MYSSTVIRDAVLCSHGRCRRKSSGKRLCTVLLLACYSCISSCWGHETTLSSVDVELFRESPLYEYAVKLTSANVDSVRIAVASIPESSVNMQEHKIGYSLLHWAVSKRAFGIVKALLNRGADPNSVSRNGTTPFMVACSIRFTIDFARLLLNNGGHVNSRAGINELGRRRIRFYDTPLIASIESDRLETVKLLCEAGADVDMIGPDQIAPLLRCTSIDIVHYMIFERGVDYTVVSVHNALKYDIGNQLRLMTYPIGSEKHKQKMEVVAFLKKKGIDYASRPIPLSVSYRFSKEYLSKY